jgi:hypothetical protein
VLLAASDPARRGQAVAAVDEASDRIETDLKALRAS